MPARSRKIAAAICFVLVAASLTAISYNLPVAVAGRIHKASGIDEVRLHLLEGRKDQATGELFLELPFDQFLTIFETKTFEGPELDDFLDRWRNVPANCEVTGNLGWRSPYGISFLKGGKTKYKVSLNWDMGQMAFKTHLFGSHFVSFNSDSPEGSALLKYFDSIMPYDRNFRAWVEKEVRALRKGN